MRSPELERTQGLCAFLPDERKTLLDVLGANSNKGNAVWYVLSNSSWEKQLTVKISSLEVQKEHDNSLYGHLLAGELKIHRTDNIPYE